MKYTSYSVEALIAGKKAESKNHADHFANHYDENFAHFHLSQTSRRLIHRVRRDPLEVGDVVETHRLILSRCTASMQIIGP